MTYCSRSHAFVYLQTQTSQKDKAPGKSLSKVKQNTVETVTKKYAFSSPIN